MDNDKLRMGVVGLGKMGLSHLAIANAHPLVDLVAVCDTSTFVLNSLRRFTRFETYSDFAQMIDTSGLDAIIVATPPMMHAAIVQAALARDIHVFCEKPFCTDPNVGARLSEEAIERKLANQVGYHARFISTFREAKRILEAELLGHVHHIRAEAYGPVVLRQKAGAWRGSRATGGGCLYDYASHVVDLVNFLIGPPITVRGSVLRSVFSKAAEDEVYSTLMFSSGVTGQIAVNWSDDSLRKMSIQATIWGTNGRLVVDRQALHLYLRRAPPGKEVNYPAGWTSRYTTELTEGVWFYLRGEEYSSQIDYFVAQVKQSNPANVSSFATGAETDRILAMILADASATDMPAAAPTSPKPSRLKSLSQRYRRGI